MDKGTHSVPYFLFAVGLRNEIPSMVPKIQMLEFLKFIHLQCYGDLYPIEDKLFERHLAHLRDMIDNYERVLPSQIPVVDGRLKIESSYPSSRHNKLADRKQKQIALKRPRPA